MTATLAPPLRSATRPEALRCGVIRRHLLLQCAGQVADAAAALSLARLLLLKVSSPSTGDVTAAITASVVPAVLSLPLAWLVADSLRRRTSLASAHVIRSLIVATAVLVSITGSRVLGLGIIAATTAAQTVTGNLRSASLGHAVPKDRLVAAYSLSAFIGKAAGVLGLGLGLGLHIVGPNAVFVGAALLHVVTAVGYITWSTDLGGRSPSVVTVTNVARAAADVCRRAGGGRVVPMAIALRAVQGASMVTLVSLFERRLDHGLVTTSAVLMATSTGVFVGTQLLPMRGRWGGPRYLRVPGVTGILAALGAVTLVPMVPFHLLTQFVLSAVFGSMRVRADVAVQATCETANRGRIHATYEAAYHVAFVTGASLATLSPLLGRQVGLSVVVLGGLVALCSCRLLSHHEGG